MAAVKVAKMCIQGVGVMSRSNQRVRSDSASEAARTAKAAQLEHKQRAVGAALAGGAIATPLLLALLDKALSLDEIESIRCRAREIAANFEDLPEGKFALACIDDFFLLRSLNRVGADRDSLSPAIVPSDIPDACQPSQDKTTTETPES
jgi:hypothetical protein